jgi:hypothetical protein
MAGSEVLQRLAEERSVHTDNPGNPRLVPVAAKVPVALADAITQLADAGDRTVSREIRRAIAAHVRQSEEEGRGPVPPPSTPAGPRPAGEGQ